MFYRTGQSALEKIWLVALLSAAILSFPMPPHFFRKPGANVVKRYIAIAHQSKNGVTALERFDAVNASSITSLKSF